MARRSDARWRERCGVTRPSPALALSAALIAVLAGCASNPIAGVDPTPSIVAETPVPTTAPDPLAPPALVFDGDCSAVLTDAEVAAATGGPVVARAGEPLDGVTIAVEQLGGIRCAWDDGDGQPQVWITVIPHAAVADAAAASGADDGSAPLQTSSRPTGTTPPRRGRACTQLSGPRGTGRADGGAVPARSGWN
jgi:hypothetical protein